MIRILAFSSQRELTLRTDPSEWPPLDLRQPSGAFQPSYQSIWVPVPYQAEFGGYRLLKLLRPQASHERNRSSDEKPDWQTLHSGLQNSLGLTRAIPRVYRSRDALIRPAPKRIRCPVLYRHDSE